MRSSQQNATVLITRRIICQRHVVRSSSYNIEHHFCCLCQCIVVRSKENRSKSSYDVKVEEKTEFALATIIILNISYTQFFTISIIMIQMVTNK